MYTKSNHNVESMLTIHYQQEYQNAMSCARSIKIRLVASKKINTHNF